MLRFGFLLMNRKGYEVIQQFVNAFGSKSVSYVVGSADEGVQQDWFVEIRDYCENHRIEWVERKCAQDENLVEDYKIAVGWRWIVENP